MSRNLGTVGVLAKCVDSQQPTGFHRHIARHQSRLLVVEHKFLTRVRTQHDGVTQTESVGGEYAALCLLVQWVNQTVIVVEIALVEAVEETCQSAVAHIVLGQLLVRDIVLHLVSLGNVLLGRTVKAHKAHRSRMTLTAQQNLVTVVRDYHQAVIAIHTLAIVDERIGCRRGADGIDENREDIVPGVESQHRTLLSQHLVVAGVFGIFAGIRIAQETMVAAQGHLARLVELAEEVEALEGIVVGTGHIILDEPAVLRAGSTERGLDIVVDVLDAKGSRLVEVIFLLEGASRQQRSADSSRQYGAAKS